MIILYSGYSPIHRTSLRSGRCGMVFRQKLNKPWFLILFLVLAISVLTMNCLIGDLFVMQLNEDRTATSLAIDTVWAKTYTEEARLYNYKTATAWQKTENAKILTHQSDMKTYDAQLKAQSQTAAAPKPPTITGINFPKEIPGNKSTMIGLLYFTDSDGDPQYVTYDVVSAVNFGGGTDNALKLDSGTWENGAIKIYLWCDGQQTVTLRATMYDYAGNRSNSMNFTFTCK